MICRWPPRLKTRQITQAPDADSRRRARGHKNEASDAGFLRGKRVHHVRFSFMMNILLKAGARALAAIKTREDGREVKVVRSLSLSLFLICQAHRQRQCRE